MAKICIDAFNISLSKGTGIATYGRNLLRAVSATGHSPEVLFGTRSAPNQRLTESNLAEGDRDNKVVTKKTRRYFETLGSRFGRFAYPVTSDNSVIWDKNKGGRPVADSLWANPNLFFYAHRSYQAYGRVTPIKFKGNRPPNILHTTTPLPILASNSVNICTFHDIIPLILPHSTTENKSKYYQLCADLLRRCDHIVSVSNKTKVDLISMFGVSENKITTTYQDVNIPDSVLQMSQDDIDVTLSQIFGLNVDDYYIYYGAIEPKKNVGRIIESYLLSGSMRPLVIVGGRRWLEAAELGLFEQIRARGVSGAERVQIYDYMPEALLLQLVKGARATLFPSLYEGFGLPVVESMLVGTPVITSTAGSLPEIAGDAAVMVDPYDVRALASAISSLDCDDGICKDLVLKGFENAKRFSSVKYRENLARVYQNCL